METRPSGQHLKRPRRLAAMLIVISLFAACGSAGSEGTTPLLGPGGAAPAETPEQTTPEMRADSYRVAPVEGSPEQTAVELGR